MIVYEKMYVYPSSRDSAYTELYDSEKASYRMFLITSENDPDFIELRMSIPDDRPMYVLYPSKSQLIDFIGNKIKFHGAPVIIPVDTNPKQKKLHRYDFSSGKSIINGKIRSGLLIHKSTVVSVKNDGTLIPDFLISNPLALLKHENILYYSTRISTGNDISNYIWKLRNKLQIHSFKSLKKDGGVK